MVVGTVPVMQLALKSARTLIFSCLALTLRHPSVPSGKERVKSRGFKDHLPPLDFELSGPSCWLENQSFLTSLSLTSHTHIIGSPGLRGRGSWVPGAPVPFRRLHKLCVNFWNLDDFFQDRPLIPVIRSSLYKNKIVHDPGVRRKAKQVSLVLLLRA